ncbi:hypothetical protein Cgig2_024077 [Carnegiea gigantea]|uniref:Uncharacterized protein n=1 Tax=Carnegiea gigantea TaxID=171969 RepID=A0A9Q1QD20_9CARY|nr:hypothetical protein Cgig2_024077 [Carnegiea gigantea]
MKRAQEWKAIKTSLFCFMVSESVTNIRDVAKDITIELKAILDSKDKNDLITTKAQRAMEAVNSARLLPHFDYVPTTGYKPSHRCARIPSPRRIEREWEASRCSYQADERSPSSRADGEVHYGVHPMCDSVLADRLEWEPPQLQPLDEECSTEVVATIDGGYA